MTIEKKADGRMRDDDPTVLEALRAFNCGMFDVPDATNPRGYVTKFWPEKAMAKAISTLQRPTREEVSGEEYIPCDTGECMCHGSELCDRRTAMNPKPAEAAEEGK